MSVVSLIASSIGHREPDKRIMETETSPRILMCPPDYFGIEYEINPWMNVRVGSDGTLARRQWTALFETLRELGVCRRSDRAGARAFPTWSSRPTRALCIMIYS